MMKKSWLKVPDCKTCINITRCEKNIHRGKKLLSSKFPYKVKKYQGEDFSKIKYFVQKVHIRSIKGLYMDTIPDISPVTIQGQTLTCGKNKNKFS